MVRFSGRHEGLRSHKAIAFISNSLRTKTYFTVRTSPQKTAKFSEIKQQAENSLNFELIKNQVKNIWIK